MPFHRLVTMVEILIASVWGLLYFCLLDLLNSNTSSNFLSEFFLHPELFIQYFIFKVSSDYFCISYLIKSIGDKLYGQTFHVYFLNIASLFNRKIQEISFVKPSRFICKRMKEYAPIIYISFHFIYVFIITNQ